MSCNGIVFVRSFVKIGHIFQALKCRNPQTQTAWLCQKSSFFLILEGKRAKNYCKCSVCVPLEGPAVPLNRELDGLPEPLRIIPKCDDDDDDDDDNNNNNNNEA